MEKIKDIGNKASSTNVVRQCCAQLTPKSRDIDQKPFFFFKEKSGEKKKKSKVDAWFPSDFFCMKLIYPNSHCNTATAPRNGSLLLVEIYNLWTEPIQWTNNPLVQSFDRGKGYYLEAELVIHDVHISKQ